MSSPSEEEDDVQPDRFVVLGRRQSGLKKKITECENGIPSEFWCQECKERLMKLNRIENLLMKLLDPERNYVVSQTNYRGFYGYIDYNKIKEKHLDEFDEDEDHDRIIGF